jgi:hypothetical protein
MLTQSPVSEFKPIYNQLFIDTFQAVRRRRRPKRRQVREDPKDDYGGSLAKFEASVKRRLLWSSDKVKAQDERLWDVTKDKGFCHAND